MTTPGGEVAGVWPGSNRKKRRIVGFGVGILLFAAAVAAVVTSRASLAHAIDSLEHPNLLLVALALPLLNWHLISVSFWVLTRRYGHVGLGEMHALIGSAWLLNYLPLRPGMFGRIAYHKRVNRIGVRDSVRVLATSVALTVASNAMICVIAWVMLDASQAAGWVIVALPGVFFCLAGLVLAGQAESAFSMAPGLAIAMGVRYFDILVWVARYAVVFRLIGYPVTLAEATLITAVSQAALLVPLVGNGLGVREWGIGFAVPVMAGQSPRALGLAADLLNRAAEVLVALPVGLIAAALLYRRTGRRLGLRSGPKARPGNDLQSEADPADAHSRKGL